MSIIQTIRDRGALISAIVIALALLGFIAMDAASGKSSLFGGGNASTTMGSINGIKIDRQEFQLAVDQQEQTLRGQGYPSGEATQQKAIEEVWNQRVNKLVLEAEFDKLGLDVSTKELNNSILFGKNPPNDIKQIGTNQQTGEFDANLAYSRLREAAKSKDPLVKAQFASFIEDQKLGRRYEKFISLLSSSTNVPKWLQEKQNEENSQMAGISFVRKSYSEIPDSSITVSNKEIEAYISKNKDNFQQEESRSIAYLSFDASPSAGDSAEIKNEITALKESFTHTADLDNFLMSNGTESYYKGYLSGKAIQIAAKDSIFRTPVGSVYGPYVDGGSYVLAKMLGVKQIPDSSKVRHILIKTHDLNRQTGQFSEVRDTTSALALMDSVKRLLASGLSFDTVCARMSDDDGSKDKGGVYEVGSDDTGTALDFKNFMFTNSTGTKGVVKTEFGYHYMEVLSQKGSGPGYKIAYIYKPIITSQNTEQTASSNAAKFASEADNEKKFDETFEKNWKAKGYNKGIAANIRPQDYSVIGMRDASRPLVRNIYNAKKGEVLQPTKVGSEYIVAIVTDVFSKGTQNAATARMQVEPLLRNEKKAEKIIAEIGQITTPEALATKLSRSVEVADSLRFSGFGAAAIAGEPKIIGAAFNPANRNKTITEAIPGRQAVYVVRVNNVVATPLADANVEEQRKAKIAQLKQSNVTGAAVNALHKAATIKDNRSKFY